MKIFAALRMALLLAPVCLLAAQPASARPAATPAAAATAQPAKPRPLPFHGKLASVDVAAKTFTVGSRTFSVTAETRIYAAGKTPSTLEAGHAGEAVSGSYIKLENGSLVARSVYWGGKTEAGKAGK